MTTAERAYALAWANTLDAETRGPAVRRHAHRQLNNAARGIATYPQDLVRHLDQVGVGVAVHLARVRDELLQQRGGER